MGMHERLVSAALLETLDSVVAPTVRDSILATALAAMNERAVPSDVTGFRDFVRGPLRRALTASLGSSLADTLVADLERLGCSIPPTVRPTPPDSSSRHPIRQAGAAPLRAARSLTPHPNGKLHSSLPPRRSYTPLPGRRPTPRPGRVRSSELPPPPCPEAETRADATRDLDPLAELPDLHAHLADCSYPAPPFSGPVTLAAQSPFGSAEYPAIEEAHPAGRTAGPPTVIVATRDQQLLRTLTEWLVDRARVINVTNVLDLVQQASVPGALVVLDCNRPAVRPVAVAALAEELPAGSRVVLWGPSVDDEAAISAFSAATEQWIRCDSSAAASLAQRCVELVS